MLQRKTTDPAQLERNGIKPGAVVYIGEGAHMKDAFCFGIVILCEAATVVCDVPRGFGLQETSRIRWEHVTLVGMMPLLAGGGS